MLPYFSIITDSVSINNVIIPLFIYWIVGQSQNVIYAL